MDTTKYTSARGVLAIFILLVSTLLVVTVAVESDAAAFVAMDACSAATPEGCYELVVECDAVTPGEALLTVAYVGADPLTSASAYADGLGGFFNANEYPASFTLTDGSWNVSTFGSTATESLGHMQPLWVSCGYTCASGDMDICAPVCDIDGAIVADECFVAVVECTPNGFVQVTLGVTTAALVAAGAGDWEAQLTTYTGNMQVDDEVVSFTSADNPIFIVDPLPNGSYRVVIEMQSLAGSTLINGAVSGTVDCATALCPADDCVFEFTTSEVACEGHLSIVITGSVPVLSADQIENITITVNGGVVPQESIFLVRAIDLQPPFPNGDGIRETVFINVAADTLTTAATYDIVAMIDGSTIYNQTFASTLTATIEIGDETDEDDDVATIASAVSIPATVTKELESTSPGPGAIFVPGVVSAGLTQSGPSELVLPAACDVDQLEIAGVNNLVREGHTTDGLPRFTADGAQLDVGTPISVELFVYRQIGGSRGEGNSVARLATLAGLLLLVVAGATSVAKSKFSDIALGGTEI